MAEYVTEETATHKAVGLQWDPLDLRVTLHWQPDTSGALVILTDETGDVRHGAWNMPTDEPLGYSPDSQTLNTLVWTTLTRLGNPWPGFTPDPIDIAMHASTYLGWDWVPK